MEHNPKLKLIDITYLNMEFVGIDLKRTITAVTVKEHTVIDRLTRKRILAKAAIILYDYLSV